MDNVFIDYAHRGASHYAPENTMMSFYLGMQMGANGIETDVHRTKDGVVVLFHDDTLERVTGESGSVSDYTWEELQKMNVRKGELFDKIPSFQDFLQHFAFRDIIFAIELKQSDVFQETADLIYQYGIEKKTVVTSFKYEEILKMRQYAPELETGYLTSEVTEQLIADMKEQGITELCPKADILTPEKVAYWHSLGFRVRAWGVADEDIMKHAYDCGVDGMTVNFPDKLCAYVKEKSR
jgi:glycerophosphoryl diester phosphodiesterase